MNEEKWVDITIGITHYSVSSCGRIISYSKKQPRYLTGGFDRDGYIRISTTIGKRMVHRLVAQSFIPNPNNLPQINHFNGIKTDNRVENLEWCSNQYNQKHAWDIGLKTPKVGEQSNLSKLTEMDVLNIKQLLNSKSIKQKELAKLYNVDPETIRRINKNLTWKHILK